MAEAEKRSAEEKKPEEEEEKKKTASEEGKKEEPPAKGDEKKSEESKQKPAAEKPPPPQEIVLRVFMHCEGCARKVRRCLRGFQGVEDVVADCRGGTVVVKGEKADPLKVLERVQKKSHRKVELISPIAAAPSEEKAQQDEVVKAEDTIKEQQPPVISVVLGVYMHCDACAQEMKRRIQRMKGVESAEPNLKSSQVKVRGIFEPQKLVDYVYKRTGKHATVIKVEPEKKEEEKPNETKENDKSKEDNKADSKSEEKEAKKEEQVANENNQGTGDGGGLAFAAGGEPPAKEAESPEDQKALELRKKEFYHYYPQYYQINYPMYPPRFVHEMNAYPPQFFSDENPNSCSVM